MLWFKKMPDAVLRRYKTSDGTFAQNKLVRTYMRGGHRWCDFGGNPLLLRDDGSVVGNEDTYEWEFI